MQIVENCSEIHVYGSALMGSGPVLKKCILMACFMNRTSATKRFASTLHAENGEGAAYQITQQV